MSPALDSFRARAELRVGGKTYDIFRLDALERAGFANIRRLPYSIRILLENLLRNEDGFSVTRDDVAALASWDASKTPEREIPFRPARVLMQDFTGVPCIVDLAAMRDAIIDLGGKPKQINPLQPAELVIDHSVQVDQYGHSLAFLYNARMELARNIERYQLLRWGQQALDNFKVVPPETGIVHQVNLEYLARVVMASKEDGRALAYPDTVIGTDSHTTMINGLGVLGWGVGGIEAEAGMLGQPSSMLIPEVIGFRLTGQLREGATATDLVLTVTEMLRKKGVVGKFVEFFGAGLSNLPLPDRATIANMAPEYGATVGYFPIDAETLAYMRFTGRPEEMVALTEAYAREQGLFRTDDSPDPMFTDVLELDLGDVVPSIAGPKRPQDRVPLTRAKPEWRKALVSMLPGTKADPTRVERWLNEGDSPHPVEPYPFESVKVVDRGKEFELQHGSVVIAAITSCTNTSNPQVMLAAGLLARNAVQKGLSVKPWVKTSLAPGSKVVTDYLDQAGLTEYLEQLGFYLVGYGCTTCIGNSGPLPDKISEAIEKADLVAVSVLSGNRNFEGRINSDVRANYLASPPLVVAYALVGHMDIDFEREPIGKGADGSDVFLRDIWPTRLEIEQAIRTSVQAEMFRRKYADVFLGDEDWQGLDVPKGELFEWDPGSTYIRKPPYFDGITMEPAPVTDIHKARVLCLLGDSVTTDHISPAGEITADSPAGQYLIEHSEHPRGTRSRGPGADLPILEAADMPRREPFDFNSFGARRGNHEVMMRGTFGNIRLRNLMLENVEGGFTRHLPDGEQMSIFDAAMKYKSEGVPLLVIAGKEYGTGSSRDWAAKGPALLGVRAVIAESYERIHRSNLVGMGILPLQFLPGESAKSLGLDGYEEYEIEGIEDGLYPGKRLKVTVSGPGSMRMEFETICRIDTPVEVEYYKHGGILPYVLRQLAAKPAGN
ncbi:MAG TPA: aconitate hydratase AcnA [Dehalococcoidia bacterium]|nr:aconitate hydratase AcnA [Dehalococcoidia bacterium]